MTAPYTIDTYEDNSMMLSVSYDIELSRCGVPECWQAEIDALPREYVVYDTLVEEPLDSERPYLFMAFPLYGDLTADEHATLTALVNRVYAEEAQP